MLTRELLRAIGDIVLRVLPDGSYVDYVGPRELLSISPDVLTGWNLCDLVPPEVAETARGCLIDVAENGKVRTFDYAIHDDGQERYFEAVVAPSNSGRLLVILRDVHARKMAQLKAQESEQRFRTMADYAPVLLWMSGLNAECEYFNKGWLEFTGRALEEELGVGWAEGVHYEDFQTCMDTYLTAFAARHSFEMEYRLRNAQGEFRWLLDRGIPRYTPDGEFAGFIGSCIDITDARVAREQAYEHTERLAASLSERDTLLVKLGRRSRELARSNSELEQFVYAASHDLRAPLRAIHMLAEWISSDLGKIENPDVIKQLDLLKKRVSRMTTLLDDLLEYSRVGRDNQVAQPVDVQQLLRDALEMLVLPEGFVVDLPHEALSLETPAGPLKQVFANLINNAVVHHHRDRGKIQILARDLDDTIEFSVSDDGPGIPEKFHDRVFQMFQTLQPRDRVEGSGIGLALVKKSVEAAGGGITLDSNGEGCTFRFTWPKRWSNGD